MPATVTVEDAFRGLPDAVKRRLARAAVEIKLRKGQALFREGDVADGLYIVLSGRMRVSRATAQRIELLHFEDVGGILAEIPVFDGTPMPATAMAAVPSRCARIPLEAIDELLRDSPDFARFVIHRLAKRGHSLLTRIDELTALTIPARVARWMLDRAARSPKGGEFTLGVSQSALAEELGTAREVVVRAIGELVQTGAIERAGRAKFTIVNLGALRAAARPDNQPERPRRRMRWSALG